MIDAEQECRNCESEMCYLDNELYCPECHVCPDASQNFTPEQLRDPYKVFWETRKQAVENGNGLPWMIGGFHHGRRS